MAHLEMSLSDPYTPTSSSTSGFDIGRPVTSVDRWADAADGANEACLVIDANAVIAAASVRACELLGFANPPAAIGKSLYHGVLPLLDFTSAATPLADVEISKIPPVQALRSERLARGLIRVRATLDVMTVDAIATPLWEHDVVIGSLTFFCAV